MNIIELLMKNCYPFGMWTEPECYGPELGKEMQKKAVELNISGDLQEFSCNKRWEEHIKGYVLRESTTYRLRPDYKPEQEIVEVEIKEDGLGKFHYDRPDGITNCSLSTAVNYFDFIGFKFEDGTVMGTPIK